MQDVVEEELVYDALLRNEHSKTIGEADKSLINNCLLVNSVLPLLSRNLPNRLLQCF